MVTKSRVGTLVLIFEFICITFIGTIPQVLPLPYLLPPIIGVLVIKIYEYKNSVKEKHLRVKIQLDILNLLLHDHIKEFRCTYLVPSGKKKLLQVFNYIPEGRGGGRKFPINKGIVGLSFKRKCPEIENFHSDDEYRRQMQEKYFFTQEDLQERTADRRSYFSFPLVDEFNNVLAVIYFDSATSETFSDDKNPSAMHLIRSVCENIKQSILR